MTEIEKLNKSYENLKEDLIKDIKKGDLILSIDKIKELKRMKLSIFKLENLNVV